MNSSLTQVKNAINHLLPAGTAPTIILSEAKDNLGLPGLTSFLQETINLQILKLQQASLTKPEQPDKGKV